MADQTRNGVIAALIALLETNIAALKSVHDGPIMLASLAESKLPACLIIEGVSEVWRPSALTSTVDIVVNLGIEILYKDAETVVRTIDDAIVKLLEQNPTISGTAILSDVMPSDFPFIFPVTTGDTKWRGRVIRVRYRMDFA